MDEIVMAILAVIILWSGYGLGYMTGVLRERRKMNKALEKATEDECKDCYPELGYKNNKLKRDTEAVKRFVESDFFKKLMKSLDETDENIHTIDFAHGYDYCKNVMKKEIHNLFEDTMNGTAGEFTRGWNLALEKVLEIMESEGKDAERQKCDTCYHNETEFSICQYCTGGIK